MNKDLIAKTVEFERGIVGHVVYDEYNDPDIYNPREWENIGTMLCAHRRYDLGDEQVRSIDGYGDLMQQIQGLADVPMYCQVCKREVASDDTVDWYHVDDVDPDEPDDDAFYCDGRHIEPINDDDLVIMPLFLFDHSGLSISTSDAHFRMADSAGWDWGQVGVIFTTRQVMESAGLLSDEDNEMTWQPRAREILKGEVETYDLYLTGQCFGFVVENKNGEVLESVWGFLGDSDVESEMKDAAEHFVKELADEELSASLPVVMNH